MIISFSGFSQNTFQILSPFIWSVALGDFHLEEIIVGHMSCQSCEWLTPRPSHSYKKGVASLLFYDTCNSGNVLNSKSKGKKLKSVLLNFWIIAKNVWGVLYSWYLKWMHKAMLYLIYNIVGEKTTHPRYWCITNVEHIFIAYLKSTRFIGFLLILLNSSRYPSTVTLNCSKSRTST